MERVMKTYISGKITGLPYEEVQKNFNEAEELLIGIGMEPVNPLNNGLPCESTWEKHMIRDIEMLMDCDSVLMLSNWFDSKGARIEKYIAEERGMTILFESKIIKNNTSIHRIQDAIHEVMGLRFEEYTTRSRQMCTYFARMIFVNHCRENENMMLPDIARIVCRDHKTMHRYINNFNDELKYNSEFREIVARINNILKSGVLQ